MKRLTSENLWIFLIVFIPACAAGIYLNQVIDYIFVDAFKRSFAAYLVYFGNEPKLSAIGFVWPPIPTLLQLPLVLIEPLNQSGLAGNILSSILLGVSAVYLNLIAVMYNVKKSFRYILLLLFVTNPLILFYGINGMSELIGIGFITMAIYYFLRHLSTNSLPSLVFASLAVACATMTRWEMGILLFVVLVIIAYIPFVNKKYSFQEAESSVVVFAVPIFFAISIWLVTSWLIVGSPIYFLHSPYSFTAHDAKQLSGSSVLSDARGSVWLSFLFVFERILYLSAAFIPFFALLVNKLRNKAERLHALTLLGFASSVIFAHILLIYVGKSYGELRYYIYVIPFSYMFLMFLFKNTISKSKQKIRVLLFFVASAVLMLATSVLTYTAMSQYEYGNQEYIVIDILKGKHNVTKSYTFKKEEVIARYIASHIKTRSVLVDDSVGFIIVYLTRKPNLFIETVDSDFKQTLADPVNSKAEYLLISNQDTHSGVNILNVEYPTLYKKGADFVTLEKDFGDWRLYKIIKPTK